MPVTPTPPAVATVVRLFTNTPVRPPQPEGWREAYRRVMTPLLLSAVSADPHAASPWARDRPPDRDAGTQTLGAWLSQHREAMFRWAMALAGTPPVGADIDARRIFVETAVAVQRQEGSPRMDSWLFGEALLAAQRHAVHGVLAETLLAGLPPELRAVLRLVARGALRAEEAWALLPQPMEVVRRSLVQARLSPAAPRQGH